MLNLWAQLSEQQLTVGQGGLVPVDVVLATIQKSLVLVGNASNYVSQMRRDTVIDKLRVKKKNLAASLKSICKSHQPKDDLLFGSAVQKALTQRAEAVEAFQKTAGKTDGPPESKKFFRRGPTSGYGRGLGRNTTKPYTYTRPNKGYTSTWRRRGSFNTYGTKYFYKTKPNQRSTSRSQP